MALLKAKWVCMLPRYSSRPSVAARKYTAMMGPEMEKSPPQTPARRLHPTVKGSVTRNSRPRAGSSSQPPSRIRKIPNPTVSSRRSMAPIQRMARRLETV